MIILKKAGLKDFNFDTFINILIITFLILVIFPVNFNHIFRELLPDNNLFEFIGRKTLNSAIQASLIITYLILLITKKKYFKLDGFTISIIILFLYSSILNLFYLDFSFQKLLNLHYHEAYYSKYLFNISTSLIIINELRNNFKLIQKCKNIIILSALIISFLFIVSQFLGYPILGVTDAMYEEKSYMNPLYSRITYYGWNQNEIALFFNFASAFILGKLFANKPTPTYKKIFYFFNFLIVANGIILTGTRMGLITLIANLIFLFFGITFRKSQIKKNLLILIFIFSAIIARLRFLHNVFMIRFRIFEENGKINKNLFELGGRLQSWENSLADGSKSPLIGKGIIKTKKITLPETSELSINSEDPLDMANIPDSPDVSDVPDVPDVPSLDQEIIHSLNNGSSSIVIYLPENVFLEIFNNSGIIGLFLLLSTIFFFLKENFIFFIHKKDSENILLTICLFGAILSLNVVYVKAFWFVLAICYATTVQIYNKNQDY